jgi:all-trans-8'-apo-beta-carotenal 15,15'-oxygenase
MMSLTSPESARSCWQTGLATSVTEEHDVCLTIEGQLPKALQGTLYRNGPGRFELGGVRKQHLLDGDGMIQAFEFANGNVRYRNRFVRTPKYLLESQAGRFIFPTWSTLAPGGILANFGNRIKCQAGVTVVPKHGKLYAFDEVALPVVLDPATLNTHGPEQVGSPGLSVDYKAHTKTDPQSGAWLILGVEQGLKMHLHLAEHGPDGKLLRAQRVSAPRSAYFHDWFATENHVVVSLQPLQVSFWRFLSGLSSYIDSMRWRPEQGNLLMVIDRNAKKSPVIIEAPARFMWHSLNAYEHGNTIVADYVGYDAPDHFIGENAAFRAVMQHRSGLAQHVGQVRRYLIDLDKKIANDEVISPLNHEFPIISPVAALSRHRYGYFTTAPQATVFHNGLARVDMQTGDRQAFYLNDRTQLGEPIYVADPSATDEQGWLLSVGLNGDTGKSFLGIFAAQHLSDGPRAIVNLDYPMPLSFHGWWHGA